jgi:hypothetical protein
MRCREILEEVSIAVAVIREAFSSLVRWYKQARSDVLVVRALDTREGRAMLAQAMLSAR